MSRAVLVWPLEARAKPLKDLPADHRPFFHFWIPALGTAASSPVGQGSVEEGVPTITWSIPSPVVVEASANEDGTLELPELYVSLCSDTAPTHSSESVVYGRSVCQIEPFFPEGVMSLQGTLTIPVDGVWDTVGTYSIRFCASSPPGAAWFRPTRLVCRPLPGMQPATSVFLWIAESSSRRHVVTSAAEMSEDGTAYFPPDTEPVAITWPLESVLLVAACTHDTTPSGTTRVRTLASAQLDLPPPGPEVVGLQTEMTIRLQSAVGMSWVEVGEVELQVTAAAVSREEDAEGGEVGEAADDVGVDVGGEGGEVDGYDGGGGDYGEGEGGAVEGGGADWDGVQEGEGGEDEGGGEGDEGEEGGEGGEDDFGEEGGEEVPASPGFAAGGDGGDGAGGGGEGEGGDTVTPEMAGVSAEVLEEAAKATDVSEDTFAFQSEGVPDSEGEGEGDGGGGDGGVGAGTQAEGGEAGGGGGGGGGAVEGAAGVPPVGIGAAETSDEAVSSGVPESSAPSQAV